MTDTCTQPGCARPVKARGLCEKDYMRAYRNGTLPPKAPPPEGCSVKGCPRPHEARGLCQRHYLRFYIRGTTELTEPQRALPPEERFRFYVSEEPCACGHGCLLWKGGKTSGYGVFYLDGKKVLAHRYAWELANDRPVPDLHQVDHVRARGCRHRACVNDAHLEPVSLEENLRRAPAGRRTENGKWQVKAFAVHAAERFWAKADRSGGPDAHWCWQAFIDQGGNAKAWWQRSTHMAREIAWLLEHGPVPEGKIPVQTCGRGDCVNPAHMKLVNRREDLARRAAVARAAKAAARQHPDGSSQDQQDAGSRGAAAVTHDDTRTAS
jgi:hypothetical protein